MSDYWRMDNWVCLPRRSQLFEVRVDVSIGKGHPVAVDDGFRMDGRHARGRCNHAREVQRVDGGDADKLAGLGGLADAAQRFDSLRAGVLLAVEAGDEAAASDGPLRLHAAETAQDFTPGDADVFRSDEVTEDDAVAEEELLGPGGGERVDEQMVV